MDFEVLANLSWREVLIAMVALLALYLVLAFLRIRRLKREKNVISTPDSVAAQSALAAYSAVQEPELSATPELPAPSPEFAFPWNEPPAGIPGQQRIEAFERELEQLRKEVGGLRAEVLLLREEQRRERSQSEVTQNVSPHYSDAMQMAMQGNDAATISQHCGISRAEAELVVALVRNRDVQ
jgi:hypothetical protein